MKNYNILITSLSGLLILANFILLMEFKPEVHRWGRIISTLAFLVLFLKDFRYNKKFLLGAFLSLLIGDFFALTYHKDVSQQAFFTLQSLAYLFLIFHAGQYFIKRKFKRYQVIYFSTIFLLNTFLMLVIGDILAEEVHHRGVVALFYVYGFSAILFICIGILYYDLFPNDLSASFLIAVAGLVLSNLMGFPAHFMDFWDFFYLDRLFYVLGTAGLVSYSYYKDKAFSFAHREPSHDHL